MCIQPSASIASAVFSGSSPVAEHHRVAAGAELAGLHRAGRSAPVSGSTILISTCGWTRPTVAVRRSRSSSTRVWHRHRRRLGHAVGDGDLGHVHLVDAPLHHLDRARRAGHDAGAQRRQVDGREVGVVLHRDEHRRHAVERRCTAPASTACSVSAGVERRAPGSPSSRRGWCSRGCPSPCRSSGRTAPGCRAGPLGVSRSVSVDEVAVVEDVAVRQRRALGEAGGARGVLDVDRVVAAQAGHPVGQRVRRHVDAATPAASSQSSVPMYTTSLQRRALGRAPRRPSPR